MPFCKFQVERYNYALSDCWNTWFNPCLRHKWWMNSNAFNQVWIILQACVGDQSNVWLDAHDRADDDWLFHMCFSILSLNNIYNQDNESVRTQSWHLTVPKGYNPLCTPLTHTFMQPTCRMKTGPSAWIIQPRHGCSDRKPITPLSCSPACWIVPHLISSLSMGKTCTDLILMLKPSAWNILAKLQQLILIHLWYALTDVLDLAFYMWYRIWMYICN